MTSFASAKRRPEWGTALRCYWLAAASPRRFRMTHRPTILLTSSEIFFSYSEHCINWIFWVEETIVCISSELKKTIMGELPDPTADLDWSGYVRCVPRGCDIAANSTVFLQGRINPGDI